VPAAEAKKAGVASEVTLLTTRPPGLFGMELIIIVVVVVAAAVVIIAISKDSSMNYRPQLRV